MPLKKLVKSNDSAIGDIQENSFSQDALSRFIFNTLEEAQNAVPGGFDIIVVGAGMYGAYCATKLFNFTKKLPGYRPQILVLQEGPFLIHEHFQNLPRGLGSLFSIPLKPLLPDGQYKIVNSDGTPEGQSVPFGRDFSGKFRPHHRCVGGKGLFWGGWTPSLTPADLAQWPAAVSDFLTSTDGYSFVSQEIGADYDIDRNGKERDFIYGTLYESLLKRSRAVVPFTLASDKYSIDRVLQPPIAVKVEAELSGMFSPDKYCSLPGLIEAIREDIDQAQGNDQNRRLIVVPNVTVLNLVTQDAVVRGVRVAVNDPVGQGEVVWNSPLPVSDQGMIVLAANCINSTRLARNSFPRPAILTPERMGANLMVHIRGNYIWQIRRTVLETIDPRLIGKIFEQAALQIEGTADGLNSSNRQGCFHFQFYAAPNAGGNAEEYLYQMMPDRDDLIETIEKLRGVTDDKEWITFGIRTCGEDFGDPDAPVEFGLSSSRSSNTSWMDTSPLAQDKYGNPEGFVQLVETPEALNLRQAQRAAAFQFIARLANVSVADVGKSDGNPDDPNLKIRLVSAIEDGLGTTYHESGTLWMGDDPEKSVTDVHGRFHHVANAYCVDQALFPTAGSANPVPTGLGLARKVARSITKRYQEEPPLADGAGFLNLFNGSFAGMWGTAGTANFQEIALPGQPPIIEAGQAGVDSGLGIIYYTPKQFKNFVLRLEWKAFSINANSGVFLRIPNPDGVALDDSFYAACTEVQIDETGKNFLASRSPQSVFGGFQEKTGAIYKLAPANQGMSKAIRPRFSADGPWNFYEITVQDTALVVALNGVKVSSTNIAPPLQIEGYLAIQCHTEIVQFRNIQLKELP